MNPKCEMCPIEGECKSYEHLCKKVRDDPDRYRPILNLVNRIPSDQTPTDQEKLRAYIQAHPCGGC